MRRSAVIPVLALALAGGVSAAEFGEPVPEGGEVITLGEALATPEAHYGRKGKYTGRITDVCQKKGCWLVLADGEFYARVMMRDHEFSVPGDAVGTAIIYGELERVELSMKEQAHLQGEARGEVRADEYRIVADGVSIPRSSD